MTKFVIDNGKNLFESYDKPEIDSLLGNKANTSGEYNEFIAGFTNQIISKDKITDETPYLFRKSGGALEIGDREFDSLVGGSIVFNQLVEPKNTTNTSYTATCVFTTDGKATINGTPSGGTATFTAISSFDAISGHKYLLIGGLSDNVYLVVSNVSVWGSSNRFDKGNGAIVGAVSSGSIGLNIQVLENYACTNVVVKAQFIDLTQMFGATIADYIYSLETAMAGFGVAFCRNYSPDIFGKYNVYNAGELLSVKTSQHNTIGFNQWDEVWELGDLNTINGENYPDNTRIRSKNYIPILPNTIYYYNCDYNSVVCFYDKDKKYINVGSNTLTANSTFTTANDACYMRFSVSSGYGTTYNNDICINISDGGRNGQYEPYVINEYPLDADLELRGIPQLVNGAIVYDGDTYAHTGAVVRKYGIVDLGSLDIVYTYPLDVYRRFQVTMPANYKKPANISEALNIIASKYYIAEENAISGNPNDLTMSGYINDNNVYIVNHAYTDANDFKTAMSGVYLVYELATPTAENADAFVSPQMVDNWGTEQYIDARAVPVPVGHSTEYDMNLRAKIETAPNAPDANGNYLMNHNNGENIYIPYVSPIPALPTVNGNYVLKCVVSGGVASLSWIEET